MAAEFYELLCGDILHQTRAKAVCMVVIDGSDGSGVSVKIKADDFRAAQEIMHTLPDELRRMAHDIEAGKREPRRETVR